MTLPSQGGMGEQGEGGEKWVGGGGEHHILGSKHEVAFTRYVTVDTHGFSLLVLSFLRLDTL